MLKLITGKKKEDEEKEQNHMITQQPTAEEKKPTRYDRAYLTNWVND